MYIWFEGVTGTGGCFGPRGEDVGPLASVRSGARLGESNGSVGSGGGNGDIESAVTEAEGWAL